MKALRKKVKSHDNEPVKNWKVVIAAGQFQSKPVATKAKPDHLDNPENHVSGIFDQDEDLIAVSSARAAKSGQAMKVGGSVAFKAQGAGHVSDRVS